MESLSGLYFVALLLLFLAVPFRFADSVATPMPYRPGYGLGSWIEPEVITEMKKEAAMRSRIILADKIQNDAASVAAELEFEDRALIDDESGSSGGAAGQGKPKTSPDAATLKQVSQQMDALMTEMWKTKFDTYMQLWNYQKQQMEALKAAAEGSGDTKGAPTTFASSVESPVDWSLSEITEKPLGFDSISINSKFHRLEGDPSLFPKKVSASVGGAAAAGAAGGGLAGSAAAKAGEAVKATQKNHEIEATLILTAFATHRNARLFKSLVLSPEKLKEAWDYYFPSDPIPTNEQQLKALAEALSKQQAGSSSRGGSGKGGKSDAGGEKIAMVSEIYLGSALVGMVHFVKRTSARNSDSLSADEIEKRMAMAKTLVSVTGDTSVLRDKAKELLDLAKASSLDLTFDLECLGYVPTLLSSKTTELIPQLKNIDPSSFGTVSGEGTPNDKSSSQSQQQSNAAELTKAIIEASKDKATGVLDINTFLNAFDDFSRAASQGKKGMGVPVGLNVKQFGKEDVVSTCWAEKQAEAKLEKKRKAEERAAARKLQRELLEQKKSQQQADAEARKKKASPKKKDLDVEEGEESEESDEENTEVKKKKASNEKDADDEEGEESEKKPEKKKIQDEEESEDEL